MQARYDRSPAQAAKLMPNCSRTKRRRLDLALLALGFCACSDATGTLQGGQPQPLPPISGNGGSSGAASASSGAGTGSSGAGAGSSGETAPVATWTYLYKTYFGSPVMYVGCGSAQQICHQAKADSGVTIIPISGFVCGTTAAECYQGMTTATPPLISATYAANPTKAPLYLALFTGGTPGATSDNMPQTGLYAFTPSDMALIAQWIKNGAPNN